MSLSHHGEAVPWGGLVLARLTEWYGYAFFVPAIFWLSHRLPLGVGRWRLALLVHFGTSLLFALLKEVICVGVASWFRPGVFTLPDVLAGDYVSEVIAFWAMVGLAHAWVFHQHARRSHDRAEDEALTSAPNEDRCYIVVREGVGYRRIRIEDIEWIDAQGNYARLNSTAGRHLIRKTMSALEKGLGPDFVRVHRGIIVNAARVERVERRSHGEFLIMLASGKVIVSGRSYNKGVRRLLA